MTQLWPVAIAPSIPTQSHQNHCTCRQHWSKWSNRCIADDHLSGGGGATGVPGIDQKIKHLLSCLTIHLGCIAVVCSTGRPLEQVEARLGAVANY